MREKAGDAQVAASNANVEAKNAETRAAQLEVQAGILRERAEDEASLRAQIEESVAWRTLTSKQQTDLGRSLQSFAGQPGHVDFNADPESGGFANNLALALRAGKWIILSDPIQMLEFRAGPLPFGTSPPLKTGVFVQSTGDLKSRNAADALVRELRRRGYDADKNDTVLTSPTTPHVVVFVDHRPYGPQGAAKLRQPRKP